MPRAVVLLHNQLPSYKCTLVHHSLNGLCYVFKNIRAPWWGTDDGSCTKCGESHILSELRAGLAETQETSLAKRSSQTLVLRYEGRILLYCYFSKYVGYIDRSNSIKIQAPYSTAGQSMAWITRARLVRSLATTPVRAGIISEAYSPVFLGAPWYAEWRTSCRQWWYRGTGLSMSAWYM